MSVALRRSLHHDISWLNYLLHPYHNKYIAGDLLSPQSYYSFFPSLPSLLLTQRMFAEVGIIIAILSAASGLTFNTPTNAVSGLTSSVSWTATSRDSVFSLRLDINFNGVNLPVIATNVDPLTDSPLAVQWPLVPSGDYTVSATSISNSDETYAQSNIFLLAASDSSSSSTSTSSPTPISNSTTSAGASSLSPGSSTQNSNQSSGASSSSTTSLAISASTSTSTSPSAIAPSAKKNAVGAIVGGVIGGIVALVLVGLFTFLNIRRRGHSRREWFERGRVKYLEDGMKANPASDVSVSLCEEVVTTKDADISNPVEKSENSPLPHGVSFIPPTLFDPASSTLYSENPRSLQSAEAPPSIHDMDSDPPDTDSTCAILGGVRYKVASETDSIPSQKTSGISAPEINPTGAICRDEEQNLDIVNSDSRTTAAPLALQGPNQTLELDNQGHDLTEEEDVLLLELQLQMTRRSSR
ncbi:hypothetical protein BT96DRAFT_927635 [Gymnopus androsaceus JB14]|uniref:Uncharacterized protein n=1 Tax=Gymnopus androsaceus JB14 TaxID=1447944 RepID=A0A6A4GNN6_9AGAR|nr:hypothetical protein BT96DRAFT_927635 [Gymnopus androsaceus JB14]